MKLTTELSEDSVFRYELLLVLEKIAASLKNIDFELELNRVDKEWLVYNTILTTKTFAQIVNTDKMENVPMVLQYANMISD